MKLSFLTTVLLAMMILPATLFAQVKTTKLDKNTIPKSIKYEGHIIDAVSFTDKDGEHIVVTTESGLTASKGADSEGYRDAALHAYHYKKTGTELKLTWQTYDFVKDCPVDVTASYLPKSFAVTDLDSNGKAEVWLMYKTVCHGDVSPSDMKIIMHEGDKKYAVRGTNKVQVSPKEYAGGKFIYDEAFKTGPKAFREYAGNLWKNNLMETWK
ncbi:M949_RS01915 family surface polysaccharide biosynthesis protein [Mucilaginibacter gilvus]|uniref:Uncharacterized protein n=1 Tax=Mucilaginibacter gilvus TaxID=2305909 RepID=A0A444MUT7_9SPHI|nr:hypothetical protein [Mucilaginibacter gilvus]RWY57393.1 hypothetical protein EPL05_02340 [Mucilaginibacter gilvus]